MRTSVAKIWTKLEVCLCTRPRGAWNKFCAWFPASCVCNGPPKLRYWACQSASLWLCVAVAALKWFFWHARRWPDSVRHVRARATASHWQDQYHHVSLNAACLCVKVESIKILTARPALNWPCAVFAYHRYNAITQMSRSRPGAGSTHAPTGERACVVRALRGVGGVGTRGAALGSVSGECSSFWLAKYKQIACQSPGWSRSNKYSKVSNSCVSFESNRIASNYLIRFEISNIRTSLVAWWGILKSSICRPSATNPMQTTASRSSLVNSWPPRLVVNNTQ